MSAFFASRRSQSDVETPESVSVAPAGRPVGFDTVIGANTHFEGAFASSGNVRMDGHFTGALEISGNILVGESADIRADINARNVSIAGTVRGNVTGNKVQLLRTGRIWGDISASALTTEEGAFIDGKITMVGHSATRPPADEEEAERALPDGDGELENGESAGDVHDAAAAEAEAESADETAR
ncbi:MAG: polymer-forming cytoskeletal protein [Chloroflexi bacterium]|nr:polymer-forming cytoskeletal protein [Chloroflexota bacterium]